MKEYRLAYDRVFLAWDKETNKHPIFEGQVLSDVSFCIEIRVFDKETNKEILFACGDDEQPAEQKIEGVCINDFFRCEYDRENGYVIKFVVKDELHKKVADKYQFKYYIDAENCYKGIEKREAFTDTESISLLTFLRMLKEYPQYFDNIDNKPAQCCAYAVWVKGEDE